LPDAIINLNETASSRSSTMMQTKAGEFPLFGFVDGGAQRVHDGVLDLAHCCSAAARVEGDGSRLRPTSAAAAAR
jgi:hypothetical protein